MPPVLANKRFPPKGKKNSRLNAVLQLGKGYGDNPFYHDKPPFNSISTLLDDSPAQFFTIGKVGSYPSGMNKKHGIPSGKITPVNKAN